MATRHEHTAAFRLSWMDSRKKWILTSDWNNGKRWLHHWQWIEASAPMDDDAVARLEKVIATEMQSWLF